MDHEEELLEKIIEFINKKTEKDTNIYVGADSKNIRGEKLTQFIVAIVVHYSGSRGSKMFALSKREPVIKAVNQRLMIEAYYALETALKIRDRIGDRKLSVHLDLNQNPEYKSNVVTKQATGMISGQGLAFKIKPHAIAATSAADYLSNNPGMVKYINRF